MKLVVSSLIAVFVAIALPACQTTGQHDQDHSGHDHAGHDHSGHDHSGHGHADDAHFGALEKHLDE